MTSQYKISLFGIAIIENSKLAVSRIGDTVINLSKLYELGAFQSILSQNYFDKDFLNDFLKRKNQIGVLLEIEYLKFLLMRIIKINILLLYMTYKM